MIYVIKFNAIKRKLIKNYIKRLLESNVPILGAIMNMVNASSAGMYSTSYYNKSYHSYYATEDIPPSVDESEPKDEDFTEMPDPDEENK